MRMYEAAPGVWLCVGVTLEEHRAAWATNYVPLEAYEDLDDPYDVWITKDDQCIRVVDMDDKHLTNARNMVRRNNPKSRWVGVLTREMRKRGLE